MRSAIRHWMAVAASIAVLVPLVAAPRAAAEDGSTVIGWTQLGIDDHIQMIGLDQPATVSIRVPSAATPASVTGLLTSTVTAVNGRVDVLDGRGVLLGSVPVQPGAASVPFSVNTAAAQVVDSAAKLSFVLRGDDPSANTCTRPPSVTLSALASTFAGASPAPSTVADFLPGYADAITVRVGPNPAGDVQQAALSLVAALTHRYRPLPVRIDVDTSSSPADGLGTGSRRVIEIRNSPKAGLSVVDGGTPSAILLISGEGEALQQQVSLFTDRRVELAQSPEAGVADVTPAVDHSSSTMTFGQLGMTGQASVLETDTLYAGIDASAFGVGAIDKATVHLRANYTPVVSGEGTVVVRSGDNVLATQRLDGSGALDLTFGIPSGAVTSNIGLALELRYFPDRECTPTNDRMMFALDPGSTVSVGAGTRNRGGFPVLPMAFTPDFTVALTHPEDVRYAAEAVNLLGQQTTRVLRPVIGPLDAAAKSSAGLLAVTSGAELARLGLDPTIAPEGTTTITGTSVMNVNLGTPLGVIQAFSHNERMVLAIDPAADPQLLNRSFDYVRSLTGGWAGLSGDVIATGASGDVVSLAVRAGGWMPDRPEATKGWRDWTWFTLGAGALAMLAIGIALTIRRKRRA